MLHYEVMEKIMDYRRIYKPCNINHATIPCNNNHAIKNGLYGNTLQSNGLYRNILPRDTVTWHKQDVEYIEQELYKADEANEISVVLTHQAPLASGVTDSKYESLDEFGLRQSLNTSFSSPLNYLFDRHKSLHSGSRLEHSSGIDETVEHSSGAWCFGHTHFCVDDFYPLYIQSSSLDNDAPSIGNSNSNRHLSSRGARIVSNQLGYSSGENSYRPNFVLSI